MFSLVLTNSNSQLCYTQHNKTVGCCFCLVVDHGVVYSVSVLLLFLKFVIQLLLGPQGAKSSFFVFVFCFVFVFVILHI